MDLPDVFIQHIQSFLRPNDAAQTMLVSKSWLRAWSTRPFLIFDPFHKQCLYSSFRYSKIPSDVIDRALECYVDQGISIVRLHLLVNKIQERWLKMARQSNVIDLHLTARSNWTPSIFQEIFLTQSLQVLSLVSHGFKVALSLTNHIKCVNLMKLDIYNLVLDEVTFLHIMSSSPLLEELMLVRCDLIDPPSYNPGIKSFTFASEYASLKRLSLVGTQINDDLLQTLLSKSLQLEDFSLSCCSKLVKPINLSSVTLKRVNFERSDAQQVLIDAPNLCKLKYKSYRFMGIPFPITITSPVTKGTVKVTVVYNYLETDESWFHGLREILAKFGKSNVKFTLSIGNPLLFDFQVLRATPLPHVNEVETLRFKGYNDLELLYAFFSISYPKIVLLDHMDTMSETKLLMKLSKDVSYRGNLECCNFYQNKCWRHYIKDANLYYVVDNEKKPLDINGLEKGLGTKEVLTLALEWKSSY